MNFDVLIFDQVIFGSLPFAVNLSNVWPPFISDSFHTRPFNIRLFNVRPFYVRCLDHGFFNIMSFATSFDVISMAAMSLDVNKSFGVKSFGIKSLTLGLSILGLSMLCLSMLCLSMLCLSMLCLSMLCLSTLCLSMLSILH